MMNHVVLSTHLPYVLLVIGVFLGAVVSSFAGFAFSAVAGALILHAFPPNLAIPLMMTFSILVQLTSILVLRKSMLWKPSLPYVAGGLLGVPVALYVLRSIGATEFRLGFGAFLIVYTGYMLFRPTSHVLKRLSFRMPNFVVGAIGGFVGGLTAMPGAAVSIVSDLRGLPKAEQRGLVQPFIAVMQAFSVTLFLASGTLSSETVMDFFIGVPSLAAGTALGLILFDRVSDIAFRRGVLGVLMFSGLALVF